MAKKKTTPKGKDTPKPAPTPVPEPTPAPEPSPNLPAGWRRLIYQGLVWLVVWATVFGAFRAITSIDWPTIKFEWRRNDAKSSLGRWILAERPPLLKSDYPAVGAELAETAKRLRAGTITTMNAAVADTIARVQPVVSEQDTWRVFITRLGGEIQGGNLEKLAEQYDEAAELFGHTKAVEALADAAGEIEDEEVDDQDAAAPGDCGGDLVSEGPDEGADQQDGDGQDNDDLPADAPADEGPGGQTDTGPGCPTGQCPAPSYPRYSNPYTWPGLPW